MTTLMAGYTPRLALPGEKPEDEQPDPQQGGAQRPGGAETPGMIGDGVIGMVDTLGLGGNPPIGDSANRVAPRQVNVPQAAPTSGMQRVDGRMVYSQAPQSAQQQIEAEASGGMKRTTPTSGYQPTLLPPAPPPPPPPPGRELGDAFSFGGKGIGPAAPGGTGISGGTGMTRWEGNMPVLYGGGQTSPGQAGAGTQGATGATAAGAGGAATGQGAIPDDLSGYLRNLLQNPYRYDSAAGEKSIRDRYATQQKEAGNASDEYYSSRGLTGSSVEDAGRQREAASIRGAEAGELFNLQREQANTAAADKSTAAQLALALRGQGLQERQFEEQIRQFDSSSAQQKEQFLAGLNISQQQVDQRATEIQNQAQQAGRSMTLAEAQAQAQNEFARQGIELQGKQLNQNQQQFETELTERKRQFDSSDATQREQFLAQMGINQQQIDLRAKEIQQQESQFGRSLSADEARFKAQQDLAERGFAESQTQFTKQFDQRNQQFDIDTLLRLLQALGLQ